MGVSAKDVLKLSAVIYGATPLPYSNLVGKAAALLNDSDDDEAEKRWRKTKAAQWMQMYRELMDQPMRDEVRRDTAMHQLRADYFEHFGEVPKERWIERLHADLVMVVHGDMAYTGDDE